jgi:hypothetical protein
MPGRQITGSRTRRVGITNPMSALAWTLALTCAQFIIGDGFCARMEHERHSEPHSFEWNKSGLNFTMREIRIRQAPSCAASRMKNPRCAWSSR